MTLAAKSLDTPDEKRSFTRGQMNVVSLPGATIVRSVLNPGWRWSTDMKPGAGTDSCQLTHTGYIISGRFAVRMDDGTEIVSGPGDAHVVGPGHDAWVIGDEQCVIIDVGPAASGARQVRCPCGVEFRAERDDQVDELIVAVQQHASGSHGHDVSREHILGEVVRV